MKNRMQDLDFEQNVAFDKVQEYEFTRRAAQRFRQVVSLDSFEDEDADVIFHYLYKEMELVSFGDHLKRYIYERAEQKGLIETTDPHTTSLMYALGDTVYQAYGDQTNIKITTKEDLELFEGYAFLKQK